MVEQAYRQNAQTRPMGNVEAYRMELWRFGNWLENFQIVWTGDKEWREGMDKLEGVW